MNKMIRKFSVLFLCLLLAGCTMAPGIENKKSVTLSGKEYEDYLKDKKIIDKLKELKSVIGDRFLFDYDEKDLEDGIYKGLFAALNDPYSVYYSKKEFEKLMEDQSGEFGGIGVVVSAAKDGYITVVSPIKGTPGDRAGIKAGDKIISVEGKSYTIEDMDKAVDVMRGEAGTEVNIVIRRFKEDDSFEDLDLKLKREMIKVESIESKMMDNKVGYVKIIQFDEPTAADFIKAVEDLQKQGAEKLVLDLRNNPGGLLSSVVEIADYLLPEGTIVSTEEKNGKKDIEKSNKEYNKIPMVVLVNEGSASASEILSGAIKDYGRAKIVGTTTFGKGIVQQVYPYNGEGFKLTISEYFTPKHNKIHHVGVVPDLEVKLDKQEDGKEAIDNQLNEALKVLGDTN